MKAPYLRVRIDTQFPGRSTKTKEIVASLQNEINSSPHASNCRLPPIRVLAHQLGISKNTVQVAYQELVSRNLVINKERDGFYVREKTSLAEQTQPSLPSVSQAGTTPYFPSPRPSARSNGDGVINLCNIFIDPDLLPTKKLTECFRSVLNQPGLQSMYSSQGFPPLRKIIAQRLSERGIPANPDFIIITSGSQQALDIVSRAIQGHHFAIESPTYYLGKRLFEMNQCQMTGLPLDPFHGIDLEHWESILAQRKPDLLYLISSFHNPTGYSYSTQELQTILSFSRKYNFGVLEDDWGSDMLSFSEYNPPLRALGGENVLYINSFTKKLLPSLRIGYLLGNSDSRNALVEAKCVSTLGNATLLEACLFEFLDRGYYDSYLQNLQTELDKRYQNCIEILRAQMPEEVKWTTPGGGPVLWLEFPKHVSLSKLEEKLLTRKVVIDKAIGRFSGAPHLHGISIGYAFLQEPQLNQGLAILAEEIKHAL